MHNFMSEILHATLDTYLRCMQNMHNPMDIEFIVVFRKRS